VARLLGLEAYGTASVGKHDLVRQLGGVPIDYRNQDFVARIMELTGDGVDLVDDPIGGENLDRSFRTLRKGGQLVSMAALSKMMGDMTTPTHSPGECLIRCATYRPTPPHRHRSVATRDATDSNSAPPLGPFACWWERACGRVSGIGSCVEASPESADGSVKSFSDSGQGTNGS
jgi:hypothetical protein